MYDELIKRLKNCATQAAPCLTCDMTDDGSCIETLMKQAADAIEELQKRVPKTPHGRLIDADDLRQSLKDSIDECHNWADEIEGGEMYARVSQSLGTFVECSLRVKAAPTIIPAEEGE